MSQDSRPPQPPGASQPSGATPLPPARDRPVSGAYRTSAEPTGQFPRRTSDNMVFPESILRQPPRSGAYPTPANLPESEAARLSISGTRPLSESGTHRRDSSSHRHMPSSGAFADRATAVRHSPERARLIALAGAFDALIRAQRVQTTNIMMVANRVHEVFTDETHPRLQFSATSLSIDNEPALIADEDHGRWLLPAFMAGLRQVYPKEDARAEDTQALAAELAQLRLVPTSLEQFADWLWSDGLEGYAIEMHSSFSEVLEITDEPEQMRQNIAAVRADMATSLATHVDVAARDLDVAAMLPEFQQPLDIFTNTARTGQLGLSIEEVDALRFECDSAAFWARQEITMALAHPKLRKAMPPSALARSLVRVAAESFDQDFLPLVAALSQHTDDFAKAVLVALEAEPVGNTIAARATLDEAGLQRLHHLLTGKALKIASGVAVGLCERAATEASAEVAVARMVAAIGPGPFLKKLDLSTMSNPARVGAARVAIRANASAVELSTVLAAVPPTAAVQLFAEMPAMLLARLGTPLKTLLEKSTQRERAQLVSGVLERAKAPVVQPVVEAFVNTMSGEWDLRTIRVIATAAVAANCADLLIPAARGSNVAVAIRLVLLEALAHSPTVGEELLRWRLAELMEPDDIRSKLIELRKARKS